MLSQEQIKELLSEEERKYKQELLSLKDNKKITELLDNGFIAKHTILFMDLDIQKHIQKYAPYKEELEIGCYGFIRKNNELEKG